MDEQTSLPVPPAPDNGECAWCGRETKRKIIIEKRGYKTAPNGIKLKRPDLEAWVCDEHWRSLRRRTDV